MREHKAMLGIVDYIVILVMLLMSGGIGVYFRFAGRKQKTAVEYLLAGKNMAIFPVTFSLMASFLSSATILGMPAEMYRYGTQYALKIVGVAIGILLSSFLFLPVFFQIQVPTAYEYIQRRFGKLTRNVCSFFFVLQSILYLAVVLYGPGLALSAVTNLSVWVSVISIGTVCTFYCTLGGMKAVLWTDVFQSVLMFFTMFAVIIKGCIDLGGVPEVVNIANEGGRLLWPGVELDPKVRYTIFNLLLQGAISGLAGYGTSQVQVQRLLTVKSLARSRMALYLSIPLCCAFMFLNCFTGIVIYAYYAKCNPMTSPSKPISSADQLLPYFIMSTLSNYPGLAGLCICGIFSAALSTLVFRD
ncbi:putative sodium-dependent multivitamin transporter isoform X2 [Uloborus diversus]|nr:putative sodium-dependent multivitamin transporter isoform X2 [Uloborus diversus]